MADSEETAVAAVATSMYDAYSRGDAAGVCAVLSDGARKQVSGGAATEAACQETLGRLFAATGGNPGRQRVGATKVDDVRVDGGSATVTVSLGRQRASTRLIKEDGNWRFASLQDPGSQAR